MSNDQNCPDEPSVRAPNPDPQASPAAPEQQRSSDNHTACESDVSVRVPDSKETAATARQGTGLAVLQQAALLPGERLEEFEELRAAIFAAKRPADVIEQIFAAEAAELTWAAFRDSRLGLARFKARAFEKLLAKCGGLENEKAARQLWMEHRNAGSFVEHMLSQGQFGFRLSDVLAETLSEHIDEAERMLRARMTKLSRRDASLREFDRHRLVVRALCPPQELDGAQSALEQQPHREAPASEGAPALDAESAPTTLAEETRPDRKSRDGE